MLSPCVNCEEREAGCHGSCGAYKEWRERYDAAKAVRRRSFPAAGYCAQWKRKRKQYEHRHRRK